MLFEMSIKAAGFVQSPKERAAEQENGLASIVNASPMWFAEGWKNGGRRRRSRKRLITNVVHVLREKTSLHCVIKMGFG